MSAMESRFDKKTKELEVGINGFVGKVNEIEKNTVWKIKDC